MDSPQILDRPLDILNKGESSVSDAWRLYFRTEGYM